ncbi:MAG TPA: hypothetical protein VG838_01130 [Opitutaceae bacterium]|nr:hypothetical protein [Opitutaceae bacterium]
MKKSQSLPPLLLALALSGCQHVQTKQKTGTDFATDGTRPATDVTEEEYQRMTPAERSALNAGRGAEVSVGWGGKIPAEPSPSGRELNDAMAAAKEKPAK